jgi:hypothetical protein
MKKQCPFVERKRCTTDCEWFEMEKDKCSFLVMKDELEKFAKIIYDYIHADLQIKRSKGSA